MRKGFITAVTVALAASMLIGCSERSGRSDRSDRSDRSEESASVRETAEETTASETVQETSSETLSYDAEHASEVSVIYGDIIDIIGVVRSGNASDDEMFDFLEVISPDFLYVPEDAPIYYTLIDIDGNGVDELLIYEHLIDGDGNAYPVIYDAYTVINSEPVHFIAGGSRNTYYLASDGTFYNMGSSGAAYTGFARYSYSNGELSIIECYFTDDSMGDICWWRSTSGLWSDDKTEATYEEAMDFFEFDYMFIPNELEA